MSGYEDDEGDGDWKLAALVVAALALVSGIGLGDWSLPLAISGLAVAAIGLAALPKLTRRLGNNTAASFALPFMLFVALAGVYVVARLSL